MNTATQNLENDHVYILQLTDVMEQMIKKNSDNTDHFESVVNIIRNYADGLHHKKEEDLLFPLFEQRTAGGHCAPVGVMLMEHEQGREYVKGMIEYIGKYKTGDVSSLQFIHHNMMGYAQLLRDHIYKENNVLFRMADDALSEDDQNMLLEKFDNIESSADDGVKVEDFVAAIEELAKMYR